eukprot:3998827-Heterocapsa_arctica.AAC.1
MCIRDSRRPVDICEWIESFARDVGLVVVCLAWDPVISPERDLAREENLGRLRSHAEAGDVLGAQAGPPCSTWSRARHRRPRPLRSRSTPWVPLPDLDPRECRAHLLGSLLALACLDIIARVCGSGGW